ncbi:putative ABC transporter B family member 29, chloroplastic-like [Capsicum annuum]|nr:putative ABC transporter B family member 29, chloroplastic-like [Capsicum annuum]
MFDKGDIYCWIRGATTRNVQELMLRFHLAETFEHRLMLHGTILELPNHFGFDQFKLLHLVEVELCNEKIWLFSKCPILEKLILRNYTFGPMTLLDVASMSLVYVALRNYVNSRKSYSECNVKISCPNLKVEEACGESVYGENTIYIGFALLGSEDHKVVAGSMKQLLTVDFGPPLHCLVIVGKTHPVEEEMLEFNA